jgi:flagellar biosynthesis protein FlhG
MNASEVLLVITPEPTSLTDAYALMKVLSLNGFKQTARVVVNQSKNPKTAQVAYTKLKDTVLKFLGIQLAPLGTIVSDARVIEAVAAQKPFITLYPNTQAAKGLKNVAENLLDKIEDSGKVFALDTFLKKCVDILTVPLKLPPKKGGESRQKPSSAASPAADPSPKPAAAPPASASAPAASPAQAPRQDDETTRRLLEQLVEKVSDVSRELSGIRTALEKGALAGLGTGTPAGRADKAPIIPLDFESFLAAQNAGDDTVGS